MSKSFHSDVQAERIFLKIPEAMARYGGSEAWWRKSVWLKSIPYYKRGGSVVFLCSDLETYFQARRVPARENAA